MTTIPRLIGAGSHGNIYTQSAKLVSKDYLVHGKIPVGNMEFAHSAQPCLYEYWMQRHLHAELPEGFPVRIPNAYTSQTRDDRCSYTMDRLYPLEGAELIQVDMTNPDSKCVMKHVGVFCGYAHVAQLLGMEPAELARDIGKLFSWLHFKMEIDGYDGELVVGAARAGGKPELWFIDFDKMACYRDMKSVGRKYSENDIVMKDITKPTRKAWFLFEAMTSMSLLPVDLELKNAFLDGYETYVGAGAGAGAEQQRELFEKVGEAVLDYEL